MNNQINFQARKALGLGTFGTLQAKYSGGITTRDVASYAAQEQGLFNSGYITSVSKRITSMSSSKNISAAYLETIAEVRSSGILTDAFVDEIAKGYQTLVSNSGFGSFFKPKPNAYPELGLGNITLTDQNVEFFAFALNQLGSAFGTKSDPIDVALNPNQDDIFDTNVRIGIMRISNDSMINAGGMASPQSPLDYTFPVKGAFNNFLKNADNLRFQDYIFSVNKMSNPGYVQINPSFSKQRGFKIYKITKGAVVFSNLMAPFQRMFSMATMNEQYASDVLGQAPIVSSGIGNAQKSILTGVFNEAVGFSAKSKRNGRLSNFASVVPIGKNIKTGQIEYGIVGQPLAGVGSMPNQIIPSILSELRQGKTPEDAMRSVIAGNPKSAAALSPLIEKRNIDGKETTILEASGLSSGLNRLVESNKSLFRGRNTLTGASTEYFAEVAPLIGGGIFSSKELTDAFPGLSISRQSTGNGDTTEVVSGTITPEALSNFVSSKPRGKRFGQIEGQSGFKSHNTTSSPEFEDAYMEFMNNPQIFDVFNEAAQNTNMPKDVGQNMINKLFTGGQKSLSSAKTLSKLNGN